jgi:hypothetical protein
MLLTALEGATTRNFISVIYFTKSSASTEMSWTRLGVACTADAGLPCVTVRYVAFCSALARMQSAVDIPPAAHQGGGMTVTRQNRDGVVNSRRLAA